MIIGYLIFGVLAYLIARFLGKQRQIDFNWSFFFSVFLTPVGGLIIIMLSKKKYEDSPEPSTIKKGFGWFILLLGIFAFVVNLIGFSKGLNKTSAEDLIISLITHVGLIGLGYYLIELGKGINFNISNDLQNKE